MEKDNLKGREGIGGGGRVQGKPGWERVGGSLMIVSFNYNAHLKSVNSPQTEFLT